MPVRLAPKQGPREAFLADRLKSINRELELDPRNLYNWNEKGVLLSRMGRLAEALKAYDTAVELDPGDEKARRNRETTRRELDEGRRGS